MKILNLNEELIPLSEEEKQFFNGGSEFSETAFWVFGMLSKAFYGFSQGAAKSKHLFYK